MVWARLMVFVIGLVVAVAGWFVEKADDFAIVQQLVAAEAFAARDAFERIAEGRISAVAMRGEPGVDALIARWPRLPEGVDVIGVGRSLSSLSFPDGGNPDAHGEVESMFELRLKVDDSHYVGKPFTWDSRDARAAIEDELSSGLLRWSGLLFFGGLLVSGAVGFYELAAEIGSRSSGTQ